MKNLSLQIDDTLYDALVALLRQFPKDKVQIVEAPEAEKTGMEFEQASRHVLEKNAELYKRLA